MAMRGLGGSASLRNHPATRLGAGQTPQIGQVQSAKSHHFDAAPTESADPQHRSQKDWERIFLEKTARNRHFVETLVSECDISVPEFFN